MSRQLSPDQRIADDIDRELYRLLGIADARHKETGSREWRELLFKILAARSASLQLLPDWRRDEVTGG